MLDMRFCGRGALESGVPKKGFTLADGNDPFADYA